MTERTALEFHGDLAGVDVSGGGEDLTPDGAFRFLIWGGTAQDAYCVFYSERDGEIGRGERAWIEFYAETGMKNADLPQHGERVG